MRVPQGESTPAEDLEQDAVVILERVRASRKIAPLPARRHPWERGFGHRITAEDVKEAWQAIKRERHARLADAEPLIAEFQILLESWLNS